MSPASTAASETLPGPVFANVPRRIQDARLAPTDQPVEVARPAATTSAVSYSLAVIRTTAASKSAVAFAAGPICDMTVLIGTGGSHDALLGRLSLGPVRAVALAASVRPD